MMNTQTNEEKMIWIGLVHVKPRHGNDILQGAVGAFVPLLAMATTVDEFAAIATTYLNEYDFDVIEIEDIQTFDERCKASDVEEDIKKLAAGLGVAVPVVMDTFQAYDDE